jgi:hypothetical protein
MGGAVRKFPLVVLIACVVLMAPAPSRAEDGLQILTWPSSLVTGPIDVEVSLGSSGAPAELFLDGKHVCTATSNDTKCWVDVGPELHVHLLELVRQRGVGDVSERVERWLNRPGREANLRIQLAVRSINDACGVRLHWSSLPDNQPVDLDVEEAEQAWRIGDEGYTFGYPCPEPNRTAVLAAAGVFEDGRRAESSVLVGSAGRIAGPQPQPVLLRPATGGSDACTALESQLGQLIVEVDRAPFEVVFVLDPEIDYANLARLEQSGAGDEKLNVDAQAAWYRTAAAFSGADHMWFVVPDWNLRRVSGSAGGPDGWLGEFFKLGPATAEGPPRLADAVTTASSASAPSICARTGSTPTEAPCFRSRKATTRARPAMLFDSRRCRLHARPLPRRTTCCKERWTG